MPDRPSPQSCFYKTLNDRLIEGNYNRVSRRTTDEIMKGNAGSIVDYLSTNLVIDKTVALGLVGILMNDPWTILTWVDKVSEKLNLDPELNTIFTELILNQFGSERHE